MPDTKEIVINTGPIIALVAGFGDLNILQRMYQRVLAPYEVYQDVCKEKGIEPDRPYSGRLNIRMSPEHHRRFAQLAAAEGKSLNAWALEVMEQARGSRSFS